MTVALQAGARVRTLAFGEGRVVRPTQDGAMVAIDALGGLELPLALHEFEVLGTAASSPNGGSPVPAAVAPPAIPLYAPASQRQPATVPTPVLSLEQRARRRGIEALRFGIVPVDGIRELTIEFEKLEDWVAGCLPAYTGRPCVSEVCGGFGTGKSHTMAAVRYIAEAQDYLTARVEVDGNSVSLSDPESVLRQLWPTLRGSDFESDTPVLDLHLRGVKRGALDDSLEPYPRVMANATAVQTLESYKCLDEAGEHLEAFLSCSDALTASDMRTLLARLLSDAGRGNWREAICEPKRLIGLKTHERPDDFINCLLGYATLAKHCGFAGLVVTIDEFEVEYNLPRAKQERIWDLIGAMEHWFSGDAEIGDAPLAIFVATVGQDGHVGDSAVERLVEACDGGVFPLPVRTTPQREWLAERIHDWYIDAYQTEATFDKDLLRAVEVQLRKAELDAEGGLIRAFIKRYVAALDAKFGPPNY